MIVPGDIPDDPARVAAPGELKYDRLSWADDEWYEPADGDWRDEHGARAASEHVVKPSSPASPDAPQPSTAPSPEGAGVAAAASGRTLFIPSVGTDGKFYGMTPLLSLDGRASNWSGTAYIDIRAAFLNNVIVPPPIGSDWPEQGGVYAGMGRAEDGMQAHVIVGPEYDGTLDHAAAMRWITDVNKVTDYLRQWSLGTRRMHALAYANVPELFSESTPYWTCDIDVEDSKWAWAQYPNGRAQASEDQRAAFRARAFRTVAITL